MVNDLGNAYYFIFFISLFLLILSANLYFRSLSLRNNIALMSSELKEKPVSVRLAELEKEKLSLSDKLENGSAVLSRLLPAYEKAEAKVNKIKAGLSLPSFKFDDDESLKSAVREI